jgi:hypothetical protein
VEFGQLLVLLVRSAPGFVFTKVVQERLGVIILSVIVAHTAWHWMTERWTNLARFPLPALDAAGAATLMRWMMAGIVTALFLWWMSGVVRRWEGLSPKAPRTDAG